MRYIVIEWNESHSTMVRYDTWGRRSKWTRRMVRAARRGRLDLAWAILTRGMRPSTYALEHIAPKASRMSGV